MNTDLEGWGKGSNGTRLFEDMLGKDVKYSNKMTEVLLCSAVVPPIEGKR
jgi:hypothetical protein